MIENRFLLFATWFPVLAVSEGALLGGHLLHSDVLSYENILHRAVGIAGAISLPCMWLIFLPPRRYLAWLEARADDAQEPSP